MKYYAFRSELGYNSMIREGKVFAFTGNETLRYILETNYDLVEIMSTFRIHLIPRLYILGKYLRFKNMKNLFQKVLQIIN